MPDYRKQANALDSLRKKARSAYLYFAFGLLFVLVAAFLLNLIYVIVVGAIVFFLYWFFLRKDIRKYRTSYKQVIALNSVGRYMKDCSYFEKNALTLQQVQKDGCIPIENTHGIVRAGITGVFQKHSQQVCMSDISYTYQVHGRGNRKQVFVISGCYTHVKLNADTGVAVVFCCRGLMPQEMQDAYFIGQGLHRIGCPLSELDDHFNCYLPDGTETFNKDEISRALLKMDENTDGQIAMKLTGQDLIVFVARRYLGIREPDYKNVITEEKINVDIFPELEHIQKIADLCT